MKNKIRKFEKTGDYSHSDKKHKCRECTCQLGGGQGTSHPGVGWCWLHEKGHSKKDCALHARAVRDAIRAGYPCDVVQFMNTTALQIRIDTEAAAAKEMISLRESQHTIIDLGKRILGYIEGKKKLVSVVDNDGNESAKKEWFTESYKDGPGKASDATLFEIFRKFAETNARIAKIELDITENDYVHMDDCKVFFGELVRIANGIFNETDGKEFMTKVQKLRQPSAGKRRRR